METAVTSRRERVRAATLEEIQQTARGLLVRDGPGGVSLRAIAREMGMTAAGLYRYYPNLDGLVEALCTTLFDECRAAMEQARDACDPGDAGGRLHAVCVAFRRWSIEHRAEFGLMFGSPLPGVEECTPEHAPKHEAGQRFAGVFAALFAEIWANAPFPVPADDEIEPELRDQLRDYVADLGAPIPLGAAKLFLSCWIRLYGMVALEAYGHLHFALTDAEPMFEAEMAEAARQLGIRP